MKDDEQVACKPNYEEELKIRCCEIADLKRALDAANSERAKLGGQYENAVMTIDELHRTVEHLKGQIEAYQYCMNCRH